MDWYRVWLAMPRGCGLRRYRNSVRDLQNRGSANFVEARFCEPRLNIESQFVIPYAELD